MRVKAVFVYVRVCCVCVRFMWLCIPMCAGGSGSRKCVVWHKHHITEQRGRHFYDTKEYSRLPQLAVFVAGTNRGGDQHARVITTTHTGSANTVRTSTLLPTHILTFSSISTNTCALYSHARGLREWPALCLYYSFFLYLTSLLADATYAYSWY